MIEVTCAIIMRDKKILVAQRSESMKLPLKWEFPGGKIEKDESANECLHRELKEELNIHVEIIKELEPSVFQYDFGLIKLIPFIVKYLSGEIILFEHKAYKWVAMRELSLLEWAPADIPILEYFLKINLEL